MKQNFKSFTAGLIVGSIVMCAIPVLGANYQNLKASYNNIKIMINGEQVNIPKAEEPFIVNGRTYVPAKYVAEGLGASVTWDGKNNTVVVNGKNNSSTTTSEITTTTQPSEDSTISKEISNTPVEYCEQNKEYITPDGISIKINKIDITNSVMNSYYIEYSLKNTTNNNITIGYLKAYLDNKDTRDNWGHWGYLKPGESIVKIFTGNYPRGSKIHYLEYNSFSEHPSRDYLINPNTLKWKIDK